MNVKSEMSPTNVQQLRVYFLTRLQSGSFVLFLFCLFLDC